jgi:hypothetical protein
MSPMFWRSIVLGFAALTAGCIIPGASPSQLVRESAASPFREAAACPLAGDAKTPAVKAANVLKNRQTAPGAADMDHNVTLGALLAPGEDSGRWNNNRGASIVGYVVGVEVGGIESANCHAIDEAGRDTHIEIALTKTAPKTQWVIVEVTPSWRAAMAAKGIDWSTHSLRDTLVGHKVQITGWLFNDWAHKMESENTAPGNPKDWRATTWEIHPITNISIGN